MHLLPFHLVVCISAFSSDTCRLRRPMAGSFQAPAAQVYLREAGLSFNAEHIDVLHYDHALRLLLVVRRHSISIYNEADGSQPPQVCTMRTCICSKSVSCVPAALWPLPSAVNLCLTSVALLLA